VSNKLSVAILKYLVTNNTITEKCPNRNHEE